MKRNPNIIDFGRKYFGQSLDMLRWDKDYCFWLCEQKWFRNHRPEIHDWIVRNISTFTTNPNDRYRLNPFRFLIPEEMILRCVELKIYPQQIQTCESIADLERLIRDSLPRRQMNLVDILKMQEEEEMTRLYRKSI